jgi:hypothetical protein
MWKLPPTRPSQPSGVSGRYVNEPIYELSVMIRIRTLVSSIVLSGTSLASAAVDFSHEVLPLLKEKCVKCHTNGKYKGGLSMDTREAILKSEGAIAGKSGESEIILRVLHSDPEERMPPETDPLMEAEVALLKRWIDEGLPWEEGLTFKKSGWKAPVRPRSVELPGGDETMNPIDRIVRAYFDEKKISAPAMLDDRAYLRRVSLDLVGLLPEPVEVESFVADKAPGKRARLASELLGRERDYAEHWLSFWNDLLRNDYAGTGFIDGGRKQVSGWLYQALLENKPYDAFVRELIDATPETEGFIRGIKWRGNVNASQVQEVQFAQNISQVFLGENMKCASCHDSFINDWKLADAYALAAIIAPSPLELHRCDKPTGEIAKAAFLFPELGTIDPAAPPKERLRQAAALMTSPGNGRLARTVVNRIWQRLLGRGLVEPVDIMGNRPWSEDVLDYLGTRLADDGYDLKKLMELIVTSRTYQSESTEPYKGPAEDYVFEGPTMKRLTSEQFVDAVWKIAGAAPGKADAPVKFSTSAATVDLPGQFIWMTADRDKHQSGESGDFSTDFRVDGAAKSGSAIITCDNSYELFVNGTLVGKDDDWMVAERYDVLKHLRPGWNSIRVHATNGGSGPNAAGLFCAIIVDGNPVTVTGKDWSVNGRPAALLGDRNTWGQPLGDAMANLAAGGGDASPVRASLVNASMLMRALGRPNREQVVTTRPSELSTLQALELNNGKEFVALLEKGAAKLIADHPEASVDAIAETLYREALGRAPDGMELAIAREIAGGKVTPEGIADLLWSVLMLPEFQLVR